MTRILELPLFHGSGSDPAGVNALWGKSEKRQRNNTAEDLFAFQCSAMKLPRVERQLLFAKAAMGRRWAFDFAFTDYKVAVEIDGVSVQRLGGRLVVLGRHASIEGIRGDHEKLNAAALLGWSVLRFLQTDVKPGLAIETTMRVLNKRGWNP